ncbi:class I SAM-dependent methyltransferase [Spiractinospora alimapuensis]|uniref:O-methyltransferase n=1 Tax=Spiractinospora alimapuensis TaxID=2820884 RepID=UPI001F3265F5|nr:O-methyltransferase [Spiractinospora alimapuensis]QVQ53312.1 class I SAM-dependent methyltransferase [Spiractinospora alimapuensis]
MTRTNLGLTPALQDYVEQHSTSPDALLVDLAEETRRRFPQHQSMQIGADQGTLMTMLARMVLARNAVEVGTFTGYSSICTARGLTADGRLLACDVNEEWTGLAREYWRRAELTDQIELRLAPALETLRALPPDPVIDFSFIDADKQGYVDYWEELVPRTRPGGLLLADNTLSYGRVVDDAEASSQVQGIRDFNARAVRDDRVELVLLPVGDGLTLARRLG